MCQKEQHCARLPTRSICRDDITFTADHAKSRALILVKTRFNAAMLLYLVPKSLVSAGIRHNHRRSNTAYR